MKSTSGLTLVLGTGLSLPRATTSFPLSGNTTLSPRAWGDLQKAPNFIPDYPTAVAGNPFLPNLYTTPEIAFYEGLYWVFAAPSPINERCFQHYFDAYSSADMVNWTKHDKVLNRADFHQEGAYHWAVCAFQSPHSVFRDGKYYLYFGAGDPEHDLSGGVAVGVADRPEGPYRDPLNHALLHRGHGDLRGARMTDPSVLIDDDGQAYLYYGGRAPSYEGVQQPKVIMVKLNRDMISLGEFKDDKGNSIVFKEVTPSQYGGAVRVFKRQNQYYMMWSEGNPDEEDSQVAYGISMLPTGPWKRMGPVLEKDDGIATSPGHAGVVNVPGTDVWYVFYNRRQLGEYTDWYACGSQKMVYCRQNVAAYKRVLAYERMEFTQDGRIKPIVMGVQDNFDDGNVYNWLVYTSGDYWVQDKQLHGRKGILALNTKLWDVVAEADVWLMETTAENGNAGLVVRLRPHPALPRGAIASQFDAWKGPDDYEGTYAGISAADGGKVVLGIAAGGKWYPLAEVSMPVQLGKRYFLRVAAREGEVEVFVDDMQTPRIVSKCNDDDSPSGLPEQPLCRYQPGMPRPYVRWDNRESELVGNVGVRVFDATAVFDNFRAHRL